MTAFHYFNNTRFALKLCLRTNLILNKTIDFLSGTSLQNWPFVKKRHKCLWHKIDINFINPGRDEACLRLEGVRTLAKFEKNFGILKKILKKFRYKKSNWPLHNLDLQLIYWIKVTQKRAKFSYYLTTLFEIFSYS